MVRLRSLACVVASLSLLGLVLAVPSGAAQAADPQSPAVAATETTGDPLFTGVSPARLFDTRPSGVTVDGSGARGGAFSGTRSVQVTGRGGIPESGVGAAVLNVTVTAPVGGGFVSVFPTGSTRPNASNVNFVKGATVPNAIIAKVGIGGKVDVFSSTRTNVIVDVAGWLPSGADFTGLDPARLVDTRPSRATVDGAEAGAGAFAGSRSFPVVGRGGVPASGVGAVVLNLTVTGPHGPGYSTVSPSGEARPTASNVNFGRGAAVANLVVAKVGVGGKVDVFNSARAGVIVDVLGWFPTGSDYTALNPARLVDSRATGATVDGAERGAGAYRGARSFAVLGRGGVPAENAGAVVLNVTVTQPAAGGFTTVFPNGESRPNASNLNFSGGQSVANLVVAKIGVDGKVSIHNSVTAHVVVDVLGWLPIGINQMDPTTVIAPPGSTTIAGFDPDNITSPVTATYNGPALATGDVVATTVDDSSFYGTVTAVAGNQVTFAPATLMDIFPILNMDLEADTETGALEATSSDGAQVPPVHTEGGSAQPLKAAKTGSCSGSVSASVSADVSVDAGKFKFDVDWHWRDGVRTASLAYTPRFEVSASAGLAGAGSCSFDFGIFDMSLPTLKFSIGPVPVWINQKIDVDIKGSMSAKAAATVAASMSAGAELGGRYSKGNGFDLINNSWIEKKFTPALTAESDANISVPVKYEAKAYGLVGFDGTASPGLELDIRPLNTTWLTLDAVLKGDIRIKVTASVGPVKFDIGHDFPTREFIRKRILTLTTGGGGGTTTTTPGNDQFKLGSVATGVHHSCAVTIGGAAKCWGHNDYGQLGDGTTTHRTTPVTVTGLESGVASITAGEFRSCAVTTTGSAKCWGNNDFGQLGDGTTTDRTTPVTVSGLSSSVASVSTGFTHSCAVTTSGVAKCWGHNGHGELGDGTTTHRTIPVTVTGLQSGIASISAASGYSCAVTTTGAAKCWGNNDYGQLGDDTTTDRTTPVTVTGLQSGIASVSASYLNSCAVTTSGAAKCWGHNGYGELGDGTTTHRTTPVTVTGLQSGIAAVAAGEGHSCAVTTSGAAKCWGFNGYGQLGDGTTTHRTTPVTVTGLSSGVVAVAAGHYYSCAVIKSGAAKCWGQNYAGKLGDGTSTDRTRPVNVYGTG